MTTSLPPAWQGELEAKLQLELSDTAMLRQALTHSSVSSENYERLEFLGDAVLDLIIGQQLYQLYPQASEGELSQMRSNLVNKSSLSVAALELGLDQSMILGTNESNSGGRKKKSILADVFEALIAAVYLQKGINATTELITRVFAERLQQAQIGLRKNSKSLLQEWLQARGLDLPLYELIYSSGKAHKLCFLVRCSVPALGLQAEAQAYTRRFAEAEAAQSVLEQCQQSLG